MYSWRDRDFTDALVTRLRRHGYQVLLDRNDFAADLELQGNIIALLERAETVIFLLSPQSVMSPWCRWEVNEMQKRDKRVIPVLLRSVSEDVVPDYLRLLNYIVMTDPEDATAFATLVRAIDAGRGITWSKRNDKIFLSYRREDTAHVAGRVYDHLERAYGPDQLFFDVEDIPFGVDFREYIKKSMIDSRVLIAVVGKRWLKRSFWPLFGASEDFVQAELELAIELNVRIIPLLVDGAQMPRKNNLPDSISQVSYLNAAPIRGGRDFRTDMQRILSQITALRQEPQLAPTA
jgi:hypothetical protein